MAVILVVDDEEPIQELLRFNLEKEGFGVVSVYDGSEVMESIRSVNPDLLVLDLMLPGVSGLDICKQIRSDAKYSELPIIMLTAKAEEIDKIVGLEIGADDYITKPFSPRELLARIRARLRRVKPNVEDTNEFFRGDLKIDFQRFQVSTRGEVVDLTPKEFELLRVLAGHPGKVYSRDELLERVWGYEYGGDSRTVDVHVRHLRQKIEKDPSNPEYIETLRGIGYRLRE